MLQSVHPKLPMRSKEATITFYVDLLGFSKLGNTDYEAYLMLLKDNIEIHFFEFKTLNPLENYGGIYIRTDSIDGLYKQYVESNVPIHSNGPLATKPWGQKEFSLLDPDNNLITFGEHLPAVVANVL